MALFTPTKTYQEPSKFSGPAHFMLARKPEATETILAGDYFPLVLRLVFRRVRIAATALLLSSCPSVCPQVSARLPRISANFIFGSNFIVAREINRP
jgi:hypothetical protein